MLSDFSFLLWQPFAYTAEALGPSHLGKQSMTASIDGQGYYRVLGVAPTATTEEIKQAYLARLHAMQPVLIASRDAAPFRRVRHAYEVLANPAERAHHDMLAGIGAYAGRLRFYRRSFNRLFDILSRKRQAPMPVIILPAEEAAAQRKAG